MVRLLIRLKFAACFKLCEAYILSSSTVYVWCGVVMVMIGDNGPSQVCGLF